MGSVRGLPWQASFVALGLIWGCSFLFIKLGLQSFSPVEVAFGRLAVGAVVLLAVARLTRTRLPRTPGTWRHLAVVGLLFCSLPAMFFAYGETRVSSILAGIINAATPLATLAVVLAAFREEQPTRERMAGLGIGFAGVLVVLGVWEGIGTAELPGVLACVAAIACYGLAYPYTRRYLVPTGLGPIALATGQVLLGAVFLVPLLAVTIAVGGIGIATPIEPSAIVGILALGALGSGIAYVLSTRIVITAGPTVASSVTYIPPIVAVAVGAAILGEPLTWNEPVGAVIVLFGVAVAQGLVRRPDRASARDRAAEEPVRGA